MKFIEVSKARQNNLKNVDVRIPWGTLTSVCGLSGSGKSSLAFDTLVCRRTKTISSKSIKLLKTIHHHAKSP